MHKTAFIDNIFPDLTKILEKRGQNNDTVKVFGTLVFNVKREIEQWTDPERQAFGKVSTRNRRAAEMLVDALRADGYAADFHWHGSCEPGGDIVVQFAPVEADLARAHHDPRR